jgi:endogenous inhibitor of DNA gyrase (YacG/DUF329 family)
MRLMSSCMSFFAGPEVAGGGSMVIKCPVCKKETVWEENPFHPFCSERCRILDLGKWASGEYRITGDKKADRREAHDDENRRDE